MKIDFLAAIDIGSNAVRLLIKRLTICNGQCRLNKIVHLRVPIRLGEDVFTQNRVSDDKAMRLLEALQGFGYLMKAYGVSAYRACATSAMRDAANGTAIILAAKEQFGIGIEIISGKEEADIVYAASDPKTLPVTTSPRLHVDVGGGSSELILYSGSHRLFHDSFQIGTVRMLSDSVTKGETDRFSSRLTELQANWSPLSMVASGGNINKAAKILGSKNSKPLRPADLERLLNSLKPLSIEQRMQNFDLNYYRADVIVPALEIFVSICKQCPSISTIFVPKIGLADGVIHNLCKQRLGSGVYKQGEFYG